MAHATILVFLLTIWATSNYILAQEGSPQGELDSEPINPSNIYEGKNERQSPGFGPPFFGGFGSMPSFGSFFNSGSFPGLSPFSGFGSLFGGSSTAPSADVTQSMRAVRSPQDDDSNSDDDDEDSDDDVPQSRLFFSSLFNTRFTTCNYTTQAGTTCGSCRQVLTCFRSNVGKLRTCKKFFPYCNNGRCSLFPGAACSSASATTATDATTTVATTSDATTTT